MSQAPVPENFDGRFVVAYLAAGVCVHLSGMVDRPRPYLT